MPELPEVETTLRGLKLQLEGKVIQDVIIRREKLRWPIPSNLKQRLNQGLISTLRRRAKYLLIPIREGTLIIHLGMSGSLQIQPLSIPPKKHDHIDIIFNDNLVLRYNDPRRFGAFLWTEEDPNRHPLLKALGPEPLTSDFNAAYLYKCCQNRRLSIKSLIMNSQIVVGIGNIYAAEALFLAKIHPEKPANQLSLVQCALLVAAIQQVLYAAIKQGGTTLKDFINSEGKPGYFAQELQVYGRGGKPCLLCGTLLSSIKLGKRSTVFCEACQPKG